MTTIAEISSPATDLASPVGGQNAEHVATTAAATDAVDTHHASGSLIQDTGFWYAIAFVLFLILLLRPIMKIVNTMLDQRIARIRKELDEARLYREEAEHLLAKYTQKQKDALAEAASILEQAKADAHALREQAGHDLERSLHVREQQALQKIADAEMQALNEVKSITADIALEATQRLITEKMDPKSLQKLSDDAIASLPKTFN